MRFIDEYRDKDAAKEMLVRIHAITTQSHRIMEVCGGQTHSIVKYGIDQLLPDTIELIHGPGCPVCVTPMGVLDQSIDLAQNEDIIFCSFGDMLRVPGSGQDLLSAKASGADVRVVYSPMDAVKIASAHPEKEVVFLAVGFETTAPANALAVIQAEQQKLDNFSILVSHVLVPPAMEAILSADNCMVDGFLAAGHVCAIMGYEEYRPIVKKYEVPIVVTGFEPLDILQGIYLCVQQLEKGQARLENQYVRIVRAEGNQQAQQLIQQVFEIAPQHWRGIGTIEDSGLRLRSSYKKYDAQKKFGLPELQPDPESECISGLIMQGLSKPMDCPAFGKACTPEQPIGAPMVSSEGACAAYYQYRQQHSETIDVIP
jgi:hydrogenase expression/formation protein HypD